MKESSHRDANNRELDEPAGCVERHKHAVQLINAALVRMSGNGPIIHTAPANPSAADTE